MIPVAELGLPLEGGGDLHLGVDESSDYVPRVYVYSTYCHDLLSILFAQLAEQKINQ